MLFLTCLEMVQVHCAVQCWNALYAVELKSSSSDWHQPSLWNKHGYNIEKNRMCINSDFSFGVDGSFLRVAASTSCACYCYASPIGIQSPSENGVGAYYNHHLRI